MPETKPGGPGPESEEIKNEIFDNNKKSILSELQSFGGEIQKFSGRKTDRIISLAKIITERCN